MTPMPPSCAMAMARRASVTVSMADEMTGILRRMERVIWVADVGLAGQDLGGGGHEKDIVERQRDGGINSERAMGPCGHAFAVS